MGFGQYSAAGQARRSKRQMVAEVGAGNIASSRMIARNTLEYVRPDGATVTRLHDTDVVTKLPGGTVEINTGGWNTSTTRDRINRALPEGFYVFTSKGAIHLNNRRVGGGEAVEFVDRATIMPDGHMDSDVMRGKAASYDSFRPRIDAYIKLMRDKGVPTDTGGDPWVAPQPDGKYVRHYVVGWLGERYVFGTFVYRAIRWCGHTDYAARHWINEFNSGRADARKLVCRQVRRYIRACLGYASS